MVQIQNAAPTKALSLSKPNIITPALTFAGQKHDSFQGAKKPSQGIVRRLATAVTIAAFGLATAGAAHSQTTGGTGGGTTPPPTGGTGGGTTPPPTDQTCTTTWGLNPFGSTSSTSTSTSGTTSGGTTTKTTYIVTIPTKTSLLSAAKTYLTNLYNTIRR